MITIRVLRSVLARNTIGDYTLFEGEVFLARPLTAFDHRLWEPHFGRTLARGYGALVVFADGARVSTGEAIVVGVDGTDWEVTGSARVE